MLACILVWTYQLIFFHDDVFRHLLLLSILFNIWLCNDVKKRTKHINKLPYDVLLSDIGVAAYQTKRSPRRLWGDISASWIGQMILPQSASAALKEKCIFHVRNEFRQLWICASELSRNAHFTLRWLNGVICECTVILGFLHMLKPAPKSY